MQTLIFFFQEIYTIFCFYYFRSNKMLPLYKLLSLFLRVFSRPLINLTKRYHANNQIQNDWIRGQFFKLGNWFYALQSRINRRYLKTGSNNITIKPLSESNAIDKGIQFFYQMIFYSIALGFPMYEIYRQVVDSKAKDKKLTTRVQKISDNISRVKEEGEKLRSKLLQSEWQVRHLTFEVSTKHLHFLSKPIDEQLESCTQILRKHANWMPQFKTLNKKGKMQYLI